MGLLRLGGAAVAVAVVAGACSAGGASVAGSTLPPAATTPTTVPVATTTAPAVTTSTTEALVPQQTPDTAAKALLGSWSHGDRVGALHVAAPAAVDALFAHPAQPYEDRGCQDPQAGNSSCAFGIGSGLVQLQTVGLAGGWVVQSVVVNP